APRRGGCAVAALRLLRHGGLARRRHGGLLRALGTRPRGRARAAEVALRQRSRRGARDAPHGDARAQAPAAGRGGTLGAARSRRRRRGASPRARAHEPREAPLAAPQAQSQVPGTGGGRRGARRHALQPRGDCRDARAEARCRGRRGQGRRAPRAVGRFRRGAARAGGRAGGALDGGIALVPLDPGHARGHRQGHPESHPAATRWGTMIREIACQFGEASRLQGVLTMPRGAARSSPAMVLLSAGLTAKSGPYRLYARIARAVAEHGVMTLRFDLGGIGSSQIARPDQSLEERTEADIRDALGWLESTHGVREFVLGGLCSGAEDAFRYAEKDERAVGVVLVDPHAYETPYWRVRGKLTRYLLNRIVFKILRVAKLLDIVEDEKTRSRVEGFEGNLINYQYMPA